MKIIASAIAFIAMLSMFYLFIAFIEMQLYVGAWTTTGRVFLVVFTLFTASVLVYHSQKPYNDKGSNEKG